MSQLVNQSFQDFLIMYNVCFYLIYNVSPTGYDLLQSKCIFSHQIRFILFPVLCTYLYEDNHWQRMKSTNQMAVMTYQNSMGMLVPQMILSKPNLLKRTEFPEFHCIIANFCRANSMYFCMYTNFSSQFQKRKTFFQKIVFIIIFVLLSRRQKKSKEKLTNK